MGRNLCGSLLLRFCRIQARARGEKETVKKITSILRDDDKSIVGGAIFLEKIAELRGGSSEEPTPIIDLFKWIVENWDQIAPIIEFIIGLF